MSIHPTALVHASAVIEPGAVIGEGCEVGPFCWIGPEWPWERGSGQAHKPFHGGPRSGDETVIGVAAREVPQDLKYHGEHTRLALASLPNSEGATITPDRGRWGAPGWR